MAEAAGLGEGGVGAEEYLTAEARARVVIDGALSAAGWVVQHRRDMKLSDGARRR